MKLKLLFLLLVIRTLSTFAQHEFITTWKTDNPGSSSDTEITIPTFSGETYNYDVDWDNDGTFDEFGITGNVTHDFGTAGTYTIRIQGTFPRIYVNYIGDNRKITAIEQWGTNTWTSMNNAFYGATNVVSNATDSPDLSAVTDMSNMFNNATAFNGDISTWNTSAVTDMSYMFYYATAFNQDLSTWNTSAVTDMSYMFESAYAFNQDLSTWNTSAVTDMSFMFRNATAFNGDISTWNTSAVTNMWYMFSTATAFNGDISTWNTSAVTDMSYMFYNTTAFNQDLSGWNTSAVTNMYGMFNNATAFNGDISTWNTSAVTNMSYMFYNAAAFNGDISTWNTSAVTSMLNMFRNATAFDQNIGAWNTNAVTNMYNMFYNATAFNQDIGGWNTNAVTNMYNMFYNATAFDQNIGAWNVESIINFGSMFTNVTLSTTNYDALLIGWNAQNLQANMTFSGGNSQYCSEAAQTARANMIASDNWTITDGGEDAACVALPTHFVTTWKTDNPGSSTDTEITIPTFPGETYNYDVDWDNDGTFDEFGITGNVTHDFGTAGTYTIRIQGTFPRIYVNYIGDREKITAIEQWGTNTWTSMNNAFLGATNVVSNATDSPDLSAVTDMSHMFANATAFNGDISTWNTSAVTDMSGMFYNATAFNGDISAWNTSAVTNMYGMFFNATAFNGDLSLWNTSAVTNMINMFSAATAFNGDISTWNTSAVTNMNSMFRNATAFNGDISTWNTSAVTDMSDMFSNATAFNGDISTWNTSAVTNMSYMFYNTTAFDQNIGAWNVEAVTNFTNMFNGVTLSTTNYDALLIGWNAQNLQANKAFSGGNSQYCSEAAQTARANMIASDNWTITDGGEDAACVALPTHFVTTWKTDNPGSSTDTEITIPTFPGETYNYDVDWDNDGTFDEFGITGNVTHDFGTAGTYTIRIQGTFPRIYVNYTGDRRKITTIEQWGTNTWTSMNNAFYGATNVVSNATDSPDLSAVTDMSYMFYYATAFNGDLSAWDTSSVTNMSYMFYNATAFNGDISIWNTSAVTDMHNMFEFAYAFNQDLSTWNTSAVTDMSYMFSNATAFNQDLSTWNTSAVTNMWYMFYYATAFNGDLSAWDTSSVTYMTAMFQNATAFNQDLNTWDTSSVINMSHMFWEATAFNADLSTWNTSAVTNMSNMFYNATAFDQNIGAWNVESIINFGGMFTNVTLSTTNYDALLIGWNAQNLQANMTFSGGNSQYCSEAAQTARANMIASDNWTITDGGLDSGCIPLSTNDYVLDSSISAYPNPVRDNLSIKCETILQQVSVFDINGRKLIEHTPPANATKTTLVFDTLNSGVYFVTITSDKGQRTIKVIKD